MFNNFNDLGDDYQLSSKNNQVHPIQLYALLYHEILVRGGGRRGEIGSDSSSHPHPHPHPLPE